MKKALWWGIALSVLLTACGGGGSGASAPAAPLKPRSTPVQVAYYGSVDTDAADSAAETGVVWSMGWGPEGYLTHLERQLYAGKSMGAQEAVIGIDTIMQQDGNEVARVRGIFTDLRAKGLLAWRDVTLFVIDEPEQQGFSDAQLQAAAAKLRTVAAEFPELATARLETNYGCANDFVGAVYFDVIDCDRYDRSAGETLGNLKAKAMGKPVRLFVGVASPWKADPLPYIKLALCDAQILGVGLFIKSTVNDRGNIYEGSGSNGMTPAILNAVRLARTGTCS